MLDVQIRKRLATGRKSGDSFSLDVSLSCATRRLVLFGHSGSGKTLTLQSLAGLVRPDGGYIKIGDDVLYASEKGIDLPARERHLGYVFQDYALFPHLTVRRNVEFALDKTKRTLFGRPSPAARKSVDDLLERFEVGHLAERYPREISGGQRQRVALARALITAPRMLLLDDLERHVAAQKLYAPRMPDDPGAEELFRQIDVFRPLIEDAAHIALIEVQHFAAQAEHERGLQHLPDFRHDGFGKLKFPEVLPPDADDGTGKV